MSTGPADDRRDGLERRLLGSVFCNHHLLELAAVARVLPSHFANPLHGALWSAMRAQHALGEVVSVHGVEGALAAGAAPELAGRTKHGTVRAALAELVRVGTDKAMEAEAMAHELVAQAQRSNPAPDPSVPGATAGPAHDLEAPPALEEGEALRIGDWLEGEIDTARDTLQRHYLRLAADPVGGMRECTDAMRAAARLATCIKAKVCLRKLGLAALLTLATEQVIALTATPALAANVIEDAFERLTLAAWARLLHVATKPGPRQAGESSASGSAASSALAANSPTHRPPPTD